MEFTFNELRAMRAALYCYERNLEKQEIDAGEQGNDYAVKSIAYQLENAEKLRCRIRDEINTRPEAQEGFIDV